MTEEAPRRSRSAVMAMVLGVLAIPLVLTPYLGALVGGLAVVSALVALVATRQGRAAGRGMAVTGLVAGLVGLVIAVLLGTYGLRTYRDCQERIGHRPDQTELEQCTTERG
jgi:Domain of unknown function (DUF4190)